ncbi:hypothetical protein M433DRAFT_511274 [Acidomyces richmondensis BFW]|nr:MAG: hypothetical protein FE78DRAFT_390314 [Acidomyces sp. 'richmondensis']KYG47189.1 hypothetical protein M433DRAFT_511274 [Acidomyces richmondensis BFW]
MESDRPQPGPPSPTKHIPEFKGFGSTRNSMTTSQSNVAGSSDGSSQPPQSASSLARSGTLSWQQRPTAKGSIRPSSTAENESLTARKEVSKEGTELSRDQIAASLGSRDPSWFRQTADRGIGSAAFRKSKDEIASGEIIVSGKRGLPGMSNEQSTEPERQDSPTPSDSVKSDIASRMGSIRESGVISSRSSMPTASITPSKPDLQTLIAQDASQQDISPMSDKTSSSGGDRLGSGSKLSMSSSQARLANATERSSSPTKGMGGFVQSAMMKRSDSVNKRWSAQQGTSLSRENSVVSVRGGFGGLQGSYSMPKLEPTFSSREASNEPSSRPTSSSSNNLSGLVISQGCEDNDGFVKPALPHHSRSKSVASNYTTNAEDGAVSPPSSPSKRFSPTKSSWIESALTRPDSPKLSPPKNTQPSWMADIAKAKAQRANAESRPQIGAPKPDDTVTLRLSSPTKMTAPFGQGMLRRSDSRDLAPVPRSSTPPVTKDLPTLDVKPKLSSATAFTAAEKSSESLQQRIPDKGEDISMPSPESNLRTDTFHSASKETVAMSEVSKSPSAPLKVKPKPEMPVKPQTDLRGTLRSRPSQETKQQETPEFLSKFGNLRKTQTEKYVAPDVFKDNIVRGKLDLTKTGGPVKSVRRDELRDSLLAKKEDWKKAKEEGRELHGKVHERKTSGPPSTPAKPEALVKRDLLSRSNHTTETSSSDKAKQATPEALARHRSLKSISKTNSDASVFHSASTGALKAKATAAAEPTKLETLSKQTSAPAELEQRATIATSKLAARFNPGLADILARGPPAIGNGSNPPSRSESPVIPRSLAAATPTDPPADGPLQDVRKGRAKGPKKRTKAAVSANSLSATLEPESSAVDTTTTANGDTRAESPAILSFQSKPPPGSAASIMAASLKGTSTAADIPLQAEKPSTPAKSPSISAKTGDKVPLTLKTTEKPPAVPITDVPDFAGFGTKKNMTSAQETGEIKEIRESSLPSVKSAARLWGRQPSPKYAATPAQIPLPSKKDDEALMRSASLLASSPARPGSKGGLEISAENSISEAPTPSPPTNLPPKPLKSSRAVSGQLQGASPNKGMSPSLY